LAVIKNTRQKTDNLLAKFATGAMLFGALQTGVPATAKELSPYELLADASGDMTLVLKDTGDSIVSTMRSKGFTQSNINTIREISDMVRAGKKAGLLQPGEYVRVISVENISPD
jgi:hypothetical protein